MTNVNVNIEALFAGRFKLEAFKTDAAGNEIPGTRRVAAEWFSNLITNAGLDLIGRQLGWGGNGQWFDACGVGSGSTPPAFTDTALVAQVARTTTRQSDNAGLQGSAPYFGWKRITYRFGTGAAAGNLTEVGIFSADTGGVCCSRALIVDGSGSPTTITVLGDETLDVTYELRNYPPTTDSTWTANITINGVPTTHSGTVRAANVSTNIIWQMFMSASPTGGLVINDSYGDNFCNVYSTTTLGNITGEPSGYGSNASGLTASSYVNGTYARDHMLTYGLDRGNFAGSIGSIRISTTVGMYQANFSPKIPKDSTKVFTLGVKVSWGRYTP